MKIGLRIAPDAIQCRLCGAESAPPGISQFNICSHCETLFTYTKKLDRRYYSHNARNKRGVDWPNIPEFEFDAFVVSRFLSASSRVENNRKILRCEAISNFSSKDYLFGYQCANEWEHFKEGRKLCHKHVNSEFVTFVCGQSKSDEQFFAEKVADACRTNDAALSEVIKALQALDAEKCATLRLPTTNTNLALALDSMGCT